MTQSCEKVVQNHKIKYTKNGCSWEEQIPHEKVSDICRLQADYYPNIEIVGLSIEICDEITERFLCDSQEHKIQSVCQECRESKRFASIVTSHDDDVFTIEIRCCEKQIL